MESVDDELFGSSSTMNTLDISQRYPKLPKKLGKESEERSEIKEEDQSSPPLKLPSKEESKDGESLSTTSQSREHGESKKSEGKNIHDNIQKGEALKEKLVPTTPDDETGNSHKEEDLTRIGSFELENDTTQRQSKAILVGKEFKYLKIKWYQNHPNKLNVFNQIGIISISCFGKIVGYEKEYISGLKNINPSEAILIDMLLNKKISETREDASQDPYPTFKSSANKSSILNLFDDKIAALNTSKSQAVENENYVEAEKLKQIITKIEKLKTYIQKLESQKIDHANNENYDQAKKLKDEIERIKNVVLSINSGGTHSRPKIIPPIINAQKTIDMQISQNPYIDASAHVRTLNSYEDFRNSNAQAVEEKKRSAYSFVENDGSSDAYTYKQRPYGSMKLGSPLKKLGILKLKQGQANNSSLDNSLVSNNDPNNLSSTINISYAEEDTEEQYFNGVKKHVRILDPKMIHDR